MNETENTAVVPESDQALIKVIGQTEMSDDLDSLFSAIPFDNQAFSDTRRC